MKRKSPTLLDEAQFMKSSSVSDQPPVAAIPKTKGVSPLNFSRLLNNELERRSTSPIVRSPGLTTNRSGEIVQSGTFSRTGNMNSLPRNKSNDYLIQQAGTISSQSQRSLDNHQEEGRLGNAMESDAGASTQAATLDRSWRTKEADLTKNLPTVGGDFSFDLERDAQVFLDFINTLEENSANSRRLNITPVFEGNQMTVCRGTTRQESSPKGNAKVQSGTDNVLGFEGKHVQPEICTNENPGFSTNSYPDQKVHPELHPVSVISPTVDIPTVLEEFEKASQLFQKGTSGFHRANATPGRSQGVAYGLNEVDQSEACSQKFTTEAGETQRHSPSRQGLLNYTSQSCGAGNASVQFYHQAEALFRVAGAPVGHVGVSAQRGYASDSEDPLDWLEQQKAKLKMRRGRENPTTSTPVDPMFLQELKLRQRTLGRTPVDEKESAKYLVSTGGVQNSKIPIQCQDMYYREYRNRNPTPSLNTGWSDSRSLTRSYDPGIDGRKGTPKFDLHLGGQLAKEIRSPLDGNRSLTLSRCTNEIPLSSCQSYSLTACYPNLYSTTDTKTESVREICNGNGHIDGGTQTEPSDQQEVHETCIAKKIIHQHRGYSPTLLDALVAAPVAVECQSTPSSSRSTERSDSGYTTASVSSTDVELPLTRPEQNILKSNVQTFSRGQNNQQGFEFNMNRPEMRYQVTTSTSSSKTNESFNPHSRPTTVSKQLQFAGTVNEQTKFPVTYSQPFYETSQQRSSSVEPATPSGDSCNFPNLSISKTLEEQIEELLAFGAQLELKQKIEPQPAENEQSIYDKRKPSAEVHEPFVYANTVKGLSDIPYQNPTYFAEEEKQMLRVKTGTYTPTSMDSQILNRQPINSDVLAGQPIRTAADTSHPTNTLDQRVSQQPRNCHDSQGQPIRTTDIRIPTEAQIFNQLSVETCLPNGELVEPVNQRIKSQTRTFSQNLYQPSAFPNHKWFAQVSEPANYHTFSNQLTRHDQSQYMGQKSPANQQLAGEWNGIGYWNSEKDTSKYASVAAFEQTQTEKPVNINGLPNHLERFRQEFQTQKRHGSESEVGFQRSLASLGETEPLQHQQQRFGATRVEKVSSGTQQVQDRSQNEVVQRIPFFSHSDSVFERPPHAVLSSTPCNMNQFAAPLRGDVYRTSSLSSSVTSQSSPSLSADRSSGGSASSNRDGTNVSPQCSLQCVRESYKEWYKPDMAREDVVNFLKYKPPGSFVIRNSTSYAGDFALAVKVSEIPAQIQHKTGSDNLEELVRHFLIESKPSGIRLKGRSNEPVFASLTSFVYQHALTPLSLPHKLLLPTNTDTISVGSGTGSLSRSSTSQSTSRAQDEISSTLIYIGTVDLETLTGPEALGKAVSQVEAQNVPPVTTTVVNFMLSSQGIVLTDTKRKLFFRRHYPLNCILYCGTDRGERRWTRDVDGSKKNTERRIFGFICRKRSSTSTGSLKFPDGNECHLLADYETGYPADSVVQLINSTLRENGYNVLK